jgi:hypothetical protein
MSTTRRAPLARPVLPLKRVCGTGKRSLPVSALDVVRVANETTPRKLPSGKRLADLKLSSRIATGIASGARRDRHDRHIAKNQSPACWGRRKVQLSVNSSRRIMKLRDIAGLVVFVLAGMSFCIAI